jgi:hypothetical protein
LNADVLAKDYDGKTPRDLARSGDHHGITAMLRKAEQERTAAAPTFLSQATATPKKQGPQEKPRTTDRLGTRLIDVTNASSDRRKGDNALGIALSIVSDSGYGFAGGILACITGNVTPWRGYARWIGRSASGIDSLW